MDEKTIRKIVLDEVQKIKGKSETKLSTRKITDSNNLMDLIRNTPLSPNRDQETMDAEMFGRLLTLQNSDNSKLSPSKSYTKQEMRDL